MTREPSDMEEDKAEWEQDICDELEEMQEQADEEYQKTLEKYEQEMKLWKEQKQQKVGIGIRQHDVLQYFDIFIHWLDFERGLA